MSEEDHRQKGWMGMATGALAIFGSIAVGAFATIYGIVAVEKSKWEHGGMYFVAAALAFGLTANAIWRR